MKRVAERIIGQAGRNGRAARLHRGYLAPCRRCGLIVVHAESTGEPFHMHRRSRLCREIAAKRLAGEHARGER